MNDIDACLQRLFRSAAAEARDELPIEAPFHFETRVLHAWRTGSTQERSWMSLPVWQGALVCACAVLVLSAVFGLRSLSNAPADELAGIDSAIRLTWMQ